MATSLKKPILFVLLATALLGGASCVRKSATDTSAGTAEISDQAVFEKASANVTTSASFENYIALGLSLSKLKRFDEALQAYQKAADLNPKAPLAWNNICATFTEQGRVADAIEMCEKSLALDPSFAFAKNNLAEANARLEKLRASVKTEKTDIYARLPKMTPAEVIDAGMRFFSARELGDAIAIWNRIGEKEPLYAMAQSNLASAYILAHEFERAEKAINTAIQLEPTNAIFKNNKVWLEQKKSGKAP